MMEQQVNIPALPLSFNGETFCLRSYVILVMNVSEPAASDRKIRQTLSSKLGCRGSGNMDSTRLATEPRKTSRVNFLATVPQTDTGG